MEIVDKLIDGLAVVSGRDINKYNPIDSKLIMKIYNETGLKYADSSGGKVINITQYPSEK